MSWVELLARDQTTERSLPELSADIACVPLTAQARRQEVLGDVVDVAMARRPPPGLAIARWR
jgi:hypothetical protein